MLMLIKKGLVFVWSSPPVIADTFTRPLPHPPDLCHVSECVLVEKDVWFRLTEPRFPSAYSFGLAPAGPLQVLTPLSPNQTVEVSLPLSTNGPVMKMDPLNNLQVTFPQRFTPQKKKIPI